MTTSAEVIPFHPPGTKYQVRSATGHVLGTFDRLDHAESLCHDGWGRTVTPVNANLDHARIAPHEDHP